MDDLKITPFDVAEALDSPEVIAEFINLSHDRDQFDEYLAAFAASVRAVGLAKVSKASGISQTEILAMFCENGNPGLKQTMKITEALGLRLSVQCIE